MRSSIRQIAGKRKKKLIICLATALALAVSLFSGIGTNTVYAAGRSRDDAVGWARSQIGRGLDYDGMYGNQCVDLVKFYYDYFGYPGYGSGNANSYAWNTLPPGWTRVYGDYQPGDIAVWKTNHSCSTCITGSYGHVGIIDSADSVGFNAIHQNFDEPVDGAGVVKITWCYVSALECAIRPSYSSGAEVSLSYTDLGTNFVDHWNAQLRGTIQNPNRVTVQSVGAYIWDDKGNLVVDHSESVNLNTSIIWQTLNIVAEAKPDGLPSGSTFTYQLWAESNGVRGYSDKLTFTTEGNPPGYTEPVVEEPVNDTPTTSNPTLEDNTSGSAQEELPGIEYGEDDISSSGSNVETGENTDQNTGISQTSGDSQSSGSQTGQPGTNQGGNGSTTNTNQVGNGSYTDTSQGGNGSSSNTSTGNPVDKPGSGTNSSSGSTGGSTGVGSNTESSGPQIDTSGSNGVQQAVNPDTGSTVSGNEQDPGIETGETADEEEEVTIPKSLVRFIKFLYALFKTLFSSDF